MTLLLAFGVLLLVGALVSCHAHATVLSTSVLFMIAGIVLGAPGLAWVDVRSADTVLEQAAEVALFVILIVDGSHLDLHELRSAWRLPGRALLLGLPITMLVLAAAAHWILGTSWLVGFVVGAALSPTDPVLVRTILEREAVPLQLRRLLSVESGLNDGLALPPLLILLHVLSPATESQWPVLAARGGLALGAAVAALAVLERIPWLDVTEGYRPLLGVAVACIVAGGSSLLGLNVLLAAYAAGITLATVRPSFAKAFQQIGEPVSELVKLAALFVFGATMAVALDAAAIIFAAIALLASRPIALLLALPRGKLPRSEWLVAAWFGPKGFASLLYAVLILHSGIPGAERLFQVIALVVATSVIVHSSTDTLIARRFERAASA